MTLTALCWIVTVLALIPALMTAVNLVIFRAPRPGAGHYAVSIILPARDEEDTIGECIDALLASRGVDLEIIVVDDSSRDRTAAIAREAAVRDRRVRLHHAPALPPGWAGKQHACYAGASQARLPVLMFMDCDVRVTPGAVAAMAGFLSRSGAALVSGFPREETGTFGEALLIPLIHVVLLAYLPIPAMRRSLQPGFGAGCGQIMLAKTEAYLRTGGHATIRQSWHDGLHLPRAFREQGYATDILDASRIASCRMYRSFAATWQGLARNAHEGMATRTALPVWTMFIGGGLIAPFLLLPLAAIRMPGSATTLVLAVATGALLLSRVAVAMRFRQALVSVPLLPVGAAVFLVIQWRALLARRASPAPVWRGRTQVSS